MTSPDLTVEQDMPVPNGATSIQSLVRDDLVLREKIGIERYGVPLQPHNGRDALRDAYEEAMDLSLYLRQAIVERGAPTTVEPSPDLVQLVLDEIDFTDGSNAHDEIRRGLTKVFTALQRTHRIEPR